jgi:hypothetical protein
LQRQQDDRPQIDVKPADQLKGDFKGGGKIRHRARSICKVASATAIDHVLQRSG